MKWPVDAEPERYAILASHLDSSAPPPSNPIRYIRFALLLCLLGVLGTGCIFSPEKDRNKPPVKPPVVYPQRNTPKRAILYLTIAWSDRDSVRIDSVYAADYEGNSLDLTDTNPALPPFTKSDEVRVVGALARDTNVSFATLDFKADLTWIESHNAADPPEWRTIQVPYFEILVIDVEQNGFRAASPTAGLTWIFEFTLRPTYPNGPSGDPVWEIVRWVETRSEN